MNGKDIDAAIYRALATIWSEETVDVEELLKGEGYDSEEIAIIKENLGV